MARPRKMISLEEQIKKQEETVLKVKEKYDSEMMKLKDLHAKRNEEKKKELLKAVENSTKTYEEIMAFICSGGGIRFWTVLMRKGQFECYFFRKFTFIA